MTPSTSNVSNSSPPNDDKNSASSHNNAVMTILPEEYVPSETTVICGRGPTVFKHPGNERFRRMVDECLQEYSNAVTKMEKTFIVREIITQVRLGSPDGYGFVKKDSRDGRWYVVDENFAREKTTQAFRDALHDQYKSSNTAKKMKKRARRAYSSTNLMESRKTIEQSLKKSGSGGYSDPLITKLRMHKAGSTFSKMNRRTSLSCPDLTVNRAPSNNAFATISEYGNLNINNGVTVAGNFNWGQPKPIMSLGSMSTGALNYNHQTGGLEEPMPAEYNCFNKSTESLADTEPESISFGEDNEDSFALEMSVDVMSGLFPAGASIEQKRQLEEQEDIFDRLVDLVSDVPAGNDPFAPRPLAV